MISSFEILVGLRYLRAKRRNRFISFISLISTGGIAIGVAVLITVLSVMNGFENELRERVLAMSAHINIIGYRKLEQDWQPVAQIARKLEDVKAIAPYIRGDGMVTQGHDVGGIQIRGILPEVETKVSLVHERMVSGNFQDLRPGKIIIGHVLAKNLELQVGDSVTVITSQDTFTRSALPRFNQFEVAGIYNIGMYEYDRRITFVHYDDALNIFRNTGYLGLQLIIDEPLNAPAVAKRLTNLFASKNRAGSNESIYSEDYFVRDWTNHHRNFFRALQQQKSMMFVILVLIVAVAAFSIVTTLIMVVTEKRADIAIMRTMGASPGSIMQIFMIQGAIIGLVGCGVGLAFGLTLALNVGSIIPAIEYLLGVNFLPADVYYISNLTAEINFADVQKIVTTAFILSLTATLYPARMAARTPPVENLRYE